MPKFSKFESDMLLVTFVFIAIRNTFIALFTIYRTDYPLKILPVRHRFLVFPQNHYGKKHQAVSNQTNDD